MSLMPINAPTRRVRLPLRKATPAAIAAASDPDALISMAVVMALTGLGESTIRKRVKKGTFPAPSHLSLRLIRWRAGDVRDWLKANAHIDPLLTLQP
jgi:predicted DNA-binding transcriptional regulator AlpA